MRRQRARPAAWPTDCIGDAGCGLGFCSVKSATPASIVPRFASCCLSCGCALPVTAALGVVGTSHARTMLPASRVDRCHLPKREIQTCIRACRPCNSRDTRFQARCGALKLDNLCMTPRTEFRCISRLRYCLQLLKLAARKRHCSAFIVSSGSYRSVLRIALARRPALRNETNTGQHGCSTFVPVAKHNL